jgi:hypothetical protein
MAANSPPPLEYAKFQLTLSGIDGGIEVRQRERSYVARTWQLNDDVRRLLELSIEFGFHTLIRNGHPRGQSAEYLGFSIAPEDLWIFVADQFSGRPNVRQITVEKRFHNIIQIEKIPSRWETAGGRNIFVLFEDAPRLFSALRRRINETPELRFGLPRFESTRVQETGILSEMDLQRILATSVGSGQFTEHFGVVTEIIENPSLLRPASDPLISAGRDIPDILLKTRETLYVLELKRGEIGNSTFEQLRRYLDNPHIMELARGRQLVGCVVGNRISPKIESSQMGPFSGVAKHQIKTLLYNYNEKRLCIECV